MFTKRRGRVKSRSPLNRFVVSSRVTRYPSESSRKTGRRRPVGSSLSPRTGRRAGHPACQVPPPTYLRAPLTARLGDTSQPMAAEMARRRDTTTKAAAAAAASHRAPGTWSSSSCCSISDAAVAAAVAAPARRLAVGLRDSLGYHHTWH